MGGGARTARRRSATGSSRSRGSATSAGSRTALLRLPGHLGRQQRGAGPAAATSSRSTRRRFVEAELAAFAVTGDAEHGARAQRAFEWFLGRNRLGRPLYDFATGGCSDGLGEEDVNRERGRRVDARVPPRAAPARRGGAAARRASAHAREAWPRRAATSRALPPASCESDPDRRPTGRTAVNVVFNPAAVAVGGETVLLARVEDAHGHLASDRRPLGERRRRLARRRRSRCSRRPQGVRGRAVGLRGCASGLGRGARVGYVITCTAYGPAGPAVFLATTEDFGTVERHRDRRRARGQERRAAARARRRQVDPLPPPDVRLRRRARGGSRSSRSSDLRSWSPPEVVMQPREGAWWDSLRIGIGPPLAQDRARLAARSTTASRRRSPARSTGRARAARPRGADHASCAATPSWVLAPSEPYERTGDVPNAVFPCGLVHDSGSGELRLYYGAADTSICLATRRRSTTCSPPCSPRPRGEGRDPGPIAWRTPPRHYGPWERVTGLLADGLVARGVDVTLFATLDSVTRGDPRRRVPAPATPRIRRSTAASGRRCTSRTRSRARASSTSSTTISTGCRSPSPALARAPLVTTIHGFSGAAILPAYRALALALRVDLRSPTARRSSTTSRTSTTASTSPSCRSPRPAATRWSRSAASIPTRAPPTRSRSRGAPAAGSSSAGSSRTSATSTSRSSRTSTATASIYLRLGRARAERAEVLGARRRCCTRSPSPSRSGSPSSRRWPAAHRSSRTERGSMPEVVDDGVTGFLVDGRRRRRSTRSSGRRARPRRRAGASRERRFSAARMVDDYLPRLRGAARLVRGLALCSRRGRSSERPRRAGGRRRLERSGLGHRQGDGRALRARRGERLRLRREHGGRRGDRRVDPGGRRRRGGLHGGRRGRRAGRGARGSVCRARSARSTSSRTASGSSRSAGPWSSPRRPGTASHAINVRSFFLTIEARPAADGAAGLRLDRERLLGRVDSVDRASPTSPTRPRRRP